MAGQKEDIANIKKVFSAIMPETKADIIEPAAMKGLYQVVFGAQVLYISPDGRYIIQGDLIDLKNKENITEEARAIQRAKLVKSIKDKNAIIFSPKVVKHTITVFTDIDCGYCRKLHRERNTYLDRGIRIRYLSFPRAGLYSSSYYKAVTVWCSKDRKKALTEAKAGMKLKRLNCDNPVKSDMALAEKFGVTGTPTIVLDSGEVIPGYVPAAKLAAILDQKTDPSSSL